MDAGNPFHLSDGGWSFGGRAVFFSARKSEAVDVSERSAGGYIVFFIATYVLSIWDRGGNLCYCTGPDSQGGCGLVVYAKIGVVTDAKGVDYGADDIGWSYLWRIFQLHMFLICNHGKKLNPGVEFRDGIIQ